MALQKNRISTSQLAPPNLCPKRLALPFSNRFLLRAREHSTGSKLAIKLATINTKLPQRTNKVFRQKSVATQDFAAHSQKPRCLPLLGGHRAPAHLRALSHPKSLKFWSGKNLPEIQKSSFLPPQCPAYFVGVSQWYSRLSVWDSNVVRVWGANRAPATA